MSAFIAGAALAVAVIALIISLRAQSQLDHIHRRHSLSDAARYIREGRQP